MQIAKQQIERVIARLEAGEISEEEAQIEIAHITADIEEEHPLSDQVRSWMLSEIDQMPITETEKQALREDLAKRSS